MLRDARHARRRTPTSRASRSSSPPGRGRARARTAKPPVEAAIGKATKEHRSGSITLSCGKLMTGVTVREWGAILMLRSLKSPESYFQAAFRVQSPWAYPRRRGRARRAKAHRATSSSSTPTARSTCVAEYGLRLATERGETTRSRRSASCINYLPIFGFTGGAMTAARRCATCSTGRPRASARPRSRSSGTRRSWSRSTSTPCRRVLDHPELLETLEQIEDFRASSNNAEQVVTSTKMLKKAKREQGGKLDPEQKKEQTETASSARRSARSCRSSSPRSPCSCT